MNIIIKSSPVPYASYKTIHKSDVTHQLISFENTSLAMVSYMSNACHTNGRMIGSYVGLITKVKRHVCSAIHALYIQQRIEVHRYID